MVDHRDGDESTDVEARAERVRAHAERLQKIVDDFLKSPQSSSIDDVAIALRQANATPDEAKAHIARAKAILERPPSPQISRPQSVEPDVPKTPEGLTNEDAVQFRKDRDAGLLRVMDERRRKALIEVEWGIVREQLAELERTRSNHADNPASALAEILKGILPASQGQLPASLLAVAPHLEQVMSPNVDKVLQKTFDIRVAMAMAGSRAIDSLIDRLQQQSLPDPMSRQIWRLLVFDRYIPFELLLANFQTGYDPRDEGKDIGGGLTLLNKEHSNAQIPLTGQLDWERCFATWSAGIVLVYRHREDELKAYHTHISSLFCTMEKSPLAVIRLDLDVRD